MTNAKPDYSYFRALCAKNNCKCTPQRFAVFSRIYGNGGHPDVDSIWKSVREQIPSITRESVFRILNELVQQKVIGRLDKFPSARFDGNPSSHGHLICEKCGAVTDIPLPDVPLDTETSGFREKYREIRVIGLCSACAASEDMK